jgi:hypothetical protein
VGAPILVRPSIRRPALGFLLVLCAYAAVFLLTTVLTMGRNPPPLWGIYIGYPTIYLVLLAGLWLYRRTSRIEVKDGFLTVARWGRSGRAIPIESIATAVITKKAAPLWTSRFDRLALLDGEGRVVMTTSSWFWRLSDLSEIAEAASESVEVFTFPSQKAEFRAKYPQTLAWAEAHPVAAVVIAVSAAVSASIAVLVLLILGFTAFLMGHAI